jgi:Double-GTPase 2
LKVGAPIGFVGCINSGKTVFLSTPHDQLMHGAPNWRVQVSDAGFDYLTDNYRSICNGERPSATQYERGRSATFYAMKAFHREQTLDLLMWDVAGEVFNQPDDPEIMEVMTRCRSVVVCVNCLSLCELDDSKLLSSADQDKILGKYFRALMAQRHRLQ